MPRRERLIIIGNGMAALRTVDELIARAPDRYEITIFGAEPQPGYNRILLSSVLAGELNFDDIVTHPPGWYEARGIALHLGERIVTVDRTGKTVRSETGASLPYDALLIATGSKPIALPVAGLDLPGVCAFRDMADVEAMLALAAGGGRAIVVGGGLLGLEAAWGLKRRGMTVTVVHLMSSLMERQLDATAAALLQRDLEARGIAFVLNGQTEEILGRDRATGVRLADGRELAGELVVMAIGTRPNIELAAAAGLDINRGIRVGDDLRTSDAAIYAVGECVEHNGQTFGLVAPLWEQARVCAARLAGDEGAVYLPQPVFASLKITGVDMFSAGTLAAAEEDHDLITLVDPSIGLYKKLIVRGDRLVGCVLYGDVGDGPWYVQLMQERSPIVACRDQLIFGRSLSEAYLSSRAALQRGATARPEAA